jgi:hypothetical protein
LFIRHHAMTGGPDGGVRVPACVVRLLILPASQGAGIGLALCPLSSNTDIAIRVPQQIAYKVEIILHALWAGCIILVLASRPTPKASDRCPPSWAPRATQRSSEMDHGRHRFFDGTIISIQ